MKLKYYLRGLGIGILITTIIFLVGIHVNQGELVSDEEVIERAKSLGMVMEDTGAKTIDELEKEQQDRSKETDTEENQTDAQKESEEKSEKSDGESNADKAEETQESSADTAQKQTVEQVEISILPGEYSDAISKKLFDAGLVDDKDAFNKYINDSNYDNLIQPGTFTIPKGSSYEEVTKILTTKQENR